MKYLIALAFALSFATPGDTQQRNCAERSTVIEKLVDGYGENRQSIGLGANNSVVETFANLDSGTWTITVTMPNGITCLLASGQGFELLDEELTPSGIEM